VPLIHNVTNLDAVAAIDDQSTDKILILFNTPEGHAELKYFLPLSFFLYLFSSLIFVYLAGRVEFLRM